jgi:type VI protein secretion system component Hcp
MANDDRQFTNSVPEADQSLPVADLESAAVDAKAAEEVKGGAAATSKVHISDIQITKHTDASSPL